MANSGSGGGGGGAIKAGEAFVALTAKDAGLKSALQAVEKRVVGFGKGVAKIGAEVAGAGAVVYGPLLATLYETVGRYGDVRKAAAQLGTTTEIFSALGYAASKAGVDTDGLVTASRHLEKTVSDAAGGSAAAAEKLGQLGLKAEDLINLPLNEQFEKIADGIQGLPNEADRTAAAMELLGKSGANLIPILRGGGAGLREMQERAKAMGFVVKGDDAKNAGLFGKAIGQAKEAVKGFWEAVGASLLPLAAQLKEYSDVFVNLVQTVRGFIENNREMVAGIATVAGIVVAAGTAIVALGGFIAAAGLAVGSLVTLVTTLGSVLAVVFSPVGLGVAAGLAAVVVLTALAAELLTTTEAGQEMLSAFETIWGGIVDVFETSYGGIVDALKAGDLSLAWEVATDGLDVLWKGFLVGLQAGWNSFKDIVVDTWIDVVAEIKAAFAEAVQWVNKQFDGILDSKVGKFLTQSGALGIVGLAADALKDADPDQIRKDAEAQKAAAHKSRDAALDATAEELVASKERLAAAREAAADARWEKEFWDSIFNQKAQQAQGGLAVAAQMASLAARGTFSGRDAGQSLGVFDVMKSIAKNTGDTADNTKGLRPEEYDP